jgi:hypothetical protein
MMEKFMACYSPSTGRLLKTQTLGGYSTADLSWILSATFLSGVAYLSCGILQVYA